MAALTNSTKSLEILNPEGSNKDSSEDSLQSHQPMDNKIATVAKKEFNTLSSAHDSHWQIKKHGALMEFDPQTFLPIAPKGTKKPSTSTSTDSKASVKENKTTVIRAKPTQKAQIIQAGEIDNQNKANASNSKFYIAFDKATQKEICFEIFPREDTDVTGVFGCFFHGTSPFKSNSPQTPSSLSTSQSTTADLENSFSASSINAPDSSSQGHADSSS